MELFVGSIVAFASTNIDDIFILMLFFANKKYSKEQVVLGQYLGIIALIAISFIGSFIGLLIDQKYVGLLGLLPIYFGIRGLIRSGNEKNKSAEPLTHRRNNTFSVAAVTFANGGDNIGVYTPLFSTLSLTNRLVMILIFLIMVLIWCFAADYLSRHPIVARSIAKYGHIIMPVVLILLGVYILYESESYRIF